MLGVFLLSGVIALNVRTDQEAFFETDPRQATRATAGQEVLVKGSTSSGQFTSVLPQKSPTPELDQFAGGASQYLVESNHVRKIAGAVEGVRIELPGAIGKAIVGRVFMASDLETEGCWLRAVKLESFKDAVLTVALETDGRIHARVISKSSEIAWQGVAEQGKPIILTQLAKRDIVPVCASPPTEGGGVEVGGETGTVPIRESRPGAPNVLYLDFDGENVGNTQWNANFTEGETIDAAASGLETEEMEQIWKEGK